MHKILFGVVIAQCSEDWKLVNNNSKSNGPFVRLLGTDTANTVPNCQIGGFHLGVFSLAFLAVPPAVVAFLRVKPFNPFPSRSFFSRAF